MTLKRSTTKSLEEKFKFKFGSTVLKLGMICSLLFSIYLSSVFGQSPEITDILLTASPVGDETDDKLEASYTSNGSVVETASSWRIGSSPFMTLYLPFEADIPNALMDYSGNNHPITVNADTTRQPKWTASGGYNGAGAFTFDGNEYLIAGEIFPLNSSYTKTAWVNIGGDNYRNILSSVFNGVRDHHFKVDPDGHLNAGHTGGTAHVRDPDMLNPGQWYFVAVTFNYNNGEMILFKDGVEIDYGIVHDTLRNLVDPAVLIGARDYQWGWKGTIDDPRIYDRALSSEQIYAMYTEGDDVIVAQETAGGDSWRIYVTPFSSSAPGTTLESSVISIQGPEISNLSLDATSDHTLDDLVESHTDGSAVVTTATSWFVDGSPESVLYLPFEGGRLNGLVDFSGSDNHARFPTSRSLHPTWTAGSGHDGSGAYVFDGGGYLLGGDILPLDASYTKAAWINMSGSDYRNIMSADFQGDNNHTFKVNPDGTLTAGHSFGNAIVQDPSALTLGEWYFVVVTFDFDTGEMILYKDGEFVVSGNVPEALRSVADATVQIGALAGSYRMDGIIDDARIFDRVLSPEQISSLHANGTSVMVAEETAGMEDWYVEVTPFANTEIGPTSTSSTLTVHSIQVSDIPGQTLQEGATFSTISLNDYVDDEEYTDGEIEWSYSGNTDLSVSIDGSNVATITAPHVDWYGTETITFTASNPKLDEASDDATFTLENSNDAPVLTEVGDQSTNEGVTLEDLSVDFSDADASDGHTITVVSDETNVTVGTISGHISGSTYDLVPAADWHGSAEITVTVTDDGDGTQSDSETYTLTVNAVNDDPVLSEVGDQSVDEDNSIIDLAVTFTDVDDTDTHTITVVSDESNVTVGTISGHTSGSTYDLVPAANWHGSAEITVTVTDDGDGAQSDSETYTLTVNAVNDDPVLSEVGDQSVYENNSIIDLAVTFTDVDLSDGHTITVVSDESNVTVAPISGHTSGSTYDLVPAANWHGSAEITVTVTDDGDGTLSDSETYTLTVNAVNEAPVLSEVGDQSVDEDNSIIDLAVTFTDVETTDTHTITVVSDETNVTVGTISGHTSGSTYDLVPAANWHGSAEITVTVTDDGDGTLSDSETYTLTVNPVNDDPVLSEVGDQSVDENNSIIDLAVTFTDVDLSDGHTITVVSDESNVTVAPISGHTSGSTYDLVPAANWHGSAEITVTVTDDGDGTLSDSETYTLTVNAVNDDPVLSEVGDQSVDEDNSIIGLAVTFTDVDDTDTHTITVVSDESNVTVGTISGHTSGSTYDLVPAANWHGSAEITVTVTDDGDGTQSDSETYTLTVNAVNDAPDMIILSNNVIDEKVAEGTDVGIFSSTDVDAGDTHQYTLVSDGGVFDVDNGAFIIVGGTLKTNAEVDYEVQDSYSILVQTDDGQGGTYILNFVIDVNDVDETAVEDSYNNSVFNVYPVPADDFVTVEIDNPENKELFLEIYSNSGKLVHNEMIFNKSEIDLTGFTDGMYILRIRGDHVYGTRKIIVKDR